MHQADIAACNTSLNEVIGKFNDILAMISVFVDLFVDTNPQIIAVAVMLKVKKDVKKFERQI